MSTGVAVGACLTTDSTGVRVITIRPPEPGDEHQLRVAQRELAAEGVDFRLTGLHDGRPFAAWLRRTREIAEGIDLPAGWVPADFLVAVDDDGQVLGRLSLRRTLRGQLGHLGGHVGYAVRPRARRRGVATRLLGHAVTTLAAEGVGRVLVTCDLDNDISRRVIERAGGEFAEVLDVTGSATKRRYWIATDRDEPPIVIRGVHKDDIEAVAEVHVRSWQAAYVGLLPQELLDGLSVSARADTWRRLLAQNLAEVLVAERDGAVAGFVSHGASRDDDAGPDTGELFAIYVHPDHLGLGVGRRLDAACRSDLAMTHRDASLWVLADNERARGFYESHGWAPDGAVRTENWGTSEKPWSTIEVRERTQLWRHEESSQP